MIPTNIKNTRVFSNTAARVSAVPAFIGQFGWQVDIDRWWVSDGLTAGAWNGGFAATTLKAQAYLELPSNGGTVPAAPAGGVSIFGWLNDILGIVNSSADAVLLDTGNLTADRTYTFPDASGIFLLDGDLSFLNGDHGNITVTGAGATAGTWTIDNGVITQAKITSGRGLMRVGLADGAALLAATPDVASQFAQANDGYFAFGNSAATGWYSGPWLLQQFSFVNVAQLNTTGSTATIHCGAILGSGNWTTTGSLVVNSDFEARADTFGNFMTAEGSNFVDNVLYIRNSSDNGMGAKGLSTVVFIHPDDDLDSGSRCITLGTGPDVVGENGNRHFLSVSHVDDATNPPLDFSIGFEQNISGGGMLFHRQIAFDNTNRTITLYGISTSASAGPIGVQVDGSGNVTLAPTSAGTVTIGGGATASELRMMEPSAGGTSYTGFKAPALAGNVIYTLPIADGTSGYALTTNGSGTLAWAAMATGSGTKTKAFFTPLQNQPPAANFATLDTRNSIACLDFDDTTEESAIFAGVMPEAASLGSGLSVVLTVAATSATTGDMRWAAQWMLCSGVSITSDSFDTAIEGTVAAPGSAGTTTSITLTTTNIDSIVAGSMYRLKVYRDVSDGGDTMAGDAELYSVEVLTVA